MDRIDCKQQDTFLIKLNSIYNNILKNEIELNYNFEFPEAIFGNLPDIKDNLFNYPIGLYGGITGIALKEILND